jgi:hypothetical protein
MKDQNRHKGRNKKRTKLSFDPSSLSLFIFHSCFFRLLCFGPKFYFFYVLILKGLKKERAAKKVRRRKNFRTTKFQLPITSILMLINVAFNKVV